MLLIFMGPSCTGKSTAAESLKKDNDIQIYTGKDYLRFAKTENEAWKKFNEKLIEASNSKELSVKSIIYVISVRNIINKLQALDNAIFVKFTANLDTIKLRFSERMNGNLPKPLEKMLEKQLKEWEDISSNLCVDTTNTEPTELIKKIIEITKI